MFFVVVLWWPLLSIFNACFDCLNEIDTLSDHIKGVFNVVKRNTNVKKSFFAWTSTDTETYWIKKKQKNNSAEIFLTCFISLF